MTPTQMTSETGMYLWAAATIAASFLFSVNLAFKLARMHNSWKRDFSLMAITFTTTILYVISFKLYELSFFLDDNHRGSAFVTVLFSSMVALFVGSMMGSWRRNTKIKNRREASSFIIGIAKIPISFLCMGYLLVMATVVSISLHEGTLGNLPEYFYGKILLVIGIGVIVGVIVGMHRSNTITHDLALWEQILMTGIIPLAGSYGFLQSLERAATFPLYVAILSFALLGVLIGESICQPWDEDGVSPMARESSFNAFNEIPYDKNKDSGLIRSGKISLERAVTEISLVPDSPASENETLLQQSV